MHVFGGGCHDARNAAANALRSDNCTYAASKKKKKKKVEVGDGGL